ncbi:MAG: SDR family NAD(P)-dependent oxidoreductase [Halioglobus sp.]|nr:SDR family NAD(P)-dependent oxidoreductase [Halioglobus sp.]
MSDYPTPNFSIDLSGQVALVTGATAGLGQRFVRVLAACGAKVAFTGRRKDRLDALADELRASGAECEPVVMDMTDREQIRAGLEQAEKALGTVTILVNNAGIPDAQYATKIDDTLFDNVMNTNLEGPWLLSCAVADRLIQAKSPGRIINIASMAAFDVQPQFPSSLYATTKGAVVRMSEAMATEWAKYFINVNVIAPATFRSEMVEDMLERTGDIAQYFPRKRICEPPQMDSTLLFLVSPSSECVTGTVIKIDDGQLGR